MIAALKQYGTNHAKRTVKRQLIRYAVLGVLVIVGFVYKLMTGESLSGGADESASPPPAASAPAPAPSTAPITAPAQAAPITSGGIDINAPKRAAQNAVAATNAQIAAQTGQTVATAAPPVSGPGSTPSGALPLPAGALPVAAATAGGATVTREMYGYGAVGRRDPFFSLILTDDLRPLLGDLRLVGILYEQSGRRAIAVMRDVQTNAQYRVANGGTLGRMRVTQIRPRAVLFSIDEFGLSRQDSLVWSDSTKVRN
ncbi:MAG TPA: hypothetical protein VFS59_10375 [Gemmatimonadaceae bacterium]|nr:hypothetical protein [Gemmatimonadaceae bacterium]